MSAPREYEFSITPEQTEALRAWFGTPKHAYAVLKMERDVPFAMLQRVWAGHPVTRVHRNAIRRRLNWWAMHTLRTTDPADFPIKLESYDAVNYQPGDDDEEVL